jgi:hypothetical protein
MVFGNYADDSALPRIAVEDKPQIAPDVPDPDPIDFTTATPGGDQGVAGEGAKAKAARENAPEYDAWET